jgi:hypothetical protein
MTEDVLAVALAAFLAARLDELAARLDENERELLRDPLKGLGYADLDARIRREIKAKREILESYTDALDNLATARKFAHRMTIGCTDIPDAEADVAATRAPVEILASIWDDHPDYPREGLKS